MLVETQYEDETLKVGIIGDLVIANWDSAPSAAQLDALEKVREPLDPYVLVNIIYNGVPSFSEDARRGVSYATQNVGKRVALGYVILIPGFGGAAVRAFVSTSMLLARSKNPIKVFSTIRASTPWVSEHLVNDTESTLTPKEVGAAFAEFRSAA